MGNEKIPELEMIISAVDQNVTTLAAAMNVECDAIIINQCHEYAYSEYAYKKHKIRCFHCDERGVGRSRNIGLTHCEKDIILFSDEDIVYKDNYAKMILEQFDKHPKADMLMFNVKQSEGRETYYNTRFGRVRWYNYGRYPAYSIAVRKESILKAGVTFSRFFGGGAKYSNGEDSLFIKECLDKKLKIYHTNLTIGSEIGRKSTWFDGYTDKFFFDRGVLYHYLYGIFALAFGFRFIYRGRHDMCREKPFWKCFGLLKDGIKSAK